MRKKFELWGKNVQLCFHLFIFFCGGNKRSATILSVFSEIYYIRAMLIVYISDRDVRNMFSIPDLAYLASNEKTTTT